MAAFSGAFNMQKFLLRMLSAPALTFVMILTALLIQPLFHSQVVVASQSSPSPDFNGNNVVDVGDFILFTEHFGTSRGDEAYSDRFDLDGDGKIGVSDFLIFTNNFGKAVPVVVDTFAPVTVHLGKDPVVIDVSGNFSDADGDTLTYTAVSRANTIATAHVDGGKVEIIPVASGNVTITVTATNPEGLSATQDIAVTVFHALGLSSVFSIAPPVIRSVDENTSGIQNIGKPILATGADDNSLTYRLNGPDASSFTIVPGSGQLQTKEGVTYDYNTKRVYSVTVEVDDGRGGIDKIPVRISVRSPHISTTYRQFVEAKENSTEPILPDFSYAGYHYFAKPVPDVTHPIFDVTSYGAIPNDNLSDQRAIESAIAAAEANGSGIVFFPPGEFLVNTDVDNYQPISINSSHIVFRGSGSRRGGTVIRQVNHLLPKIPHYRGSVPFMFTFIPSDTTHAETLTHVTESADRETFWLTVADASRLKVGQWIQIILKTTNTAAIEQYLNPYTVRDFRELASKGVEVDEKNRIAEIQGNRIRLNKPLRSYVNAAYDWQVRSFPPYLEEVGVEDISFHGSFAEAFVHHINAIHDGGWSLLKFNRCVNSWVRRTSFVNISRGPSFGNSEAISVYQVSVVGNRGHYGFSISTCSGIWVGLSEDLADQFHGANLSGLANGNVYYRFDMSPKQPVDIHKTRPSHDNLYDLVEHGRLYGSSGPGIPPHHYKRLVFWNFNHGGHHTYYDFFSANPQFFRPIVVGFHGNPANFYSEHLEVLESNGIVVEPESLFEAQLELRLGTLPVWLNTLRTEWEMLRNIPLPNGRPAVKERNRINTLTLTMNGDRTVDVANYFIEPDGDPMTFSASSSDEGIATVEVTGSVVTITPLALGRATITVGASDGRFSTQQLIGVAVTDKTSMYWVDDGTDLIQRANLDGNNVENLISKGAESITSIALDIAGGKIYWVNHRGPIQRADLNGNNVENLTSEGVTSIALDIAGGKIYWVNRKGPIQRANLDGNNVENLTNRLNKLTSIALDIAGGKMYWVNRDKNKIQRANLDGSNIEDLTTERLRNPIAIALDIAGGKIYWVNRAGPIQRANLDGSNIEDLIAGRGLSDLTAIALDIAGGRMYWVNRGKNKIQRADLDGSNIEDLMTEELYKPTAIALGF